MEKLTLPLFRGLTPEDLGQMDRYRCLRQKQFARREIIFHVGETVHEVGGVLSGSVHIENVDPWGNKSQTGPGQTFAETYAFCGEPLMVDAVAAEDCEVLFLDVSAPLLPPCRTPLAGTAAAQPAADLHAQEPVPLPPDLLHHA